MKERGAFGDEFINNIYIQTPTKPQTPDSYEMPGASTGVCSILLDTCIVKGALEIISIIL